MGFRGQRLARALIPAFVLVALLGYFAGHARSHGESAGALRTAAGARVVLSYPSSWKPARKGPGIPGLPIGQPVLLAPDGNAAQAGLLAGAVSLNESSPLPATFVAGLRSPPETEVVSLLEMQAYRYAHLNIPGFARMLTVFVIPNPHGEATALACYASSALSATLRTCEQIVATVTLVAQDKTFELTPEPAYARQISTSVAALDQLRVPLRRELRSNITPERVQRIATSLAAGFSRAGASLSGLEPSSTAGPAQRALSESLVQAGNAYRALASAGARESANGYAAARARVYAAESKVDSALENFGLLGYDPSNQASSGGSS